MRLIQKIAGKNICLRSADADDADFILTLRLNPNLNQFIGQTSPSIAEQKQWIAKKLEQENDYHLIIEGLDGHPFGTIAIYDIDDNKKRAEWGRWVIAEDTPFYVAFESAILIYYFGFYDLGLTEIYNGVQNANQKVVNFHLGMGSIITRQDEKETWFTYSKEALKKALEKYTQFHSVQVAEDH